MPWHQRLLFVVVALLAALPAVGQDEFSGYPYVIDKYAVSGSLQPDSSFLVTEVIDTTFRESRHGIFRRIPFEFDTGKGIVRKTMIDRIKVTDATGSPYTTKVTREGAYIRIRIGDADIELSPGTQKTYIVSYRVQNAINWFDKNADWEPYCELYWNFTGNDWDTVIRSFSYRVDFPTVTSARAKILSGYEGSSSANTAPGFGKYAADPETATTISLTKTSVSGERTTPLNQGEGMTIVLNLPEKTMTPPTAWQQVWWALGSNSGFLIPLIVFAVLFPAFLIKGRDPEGKRCEVMFEPPDGMSASECGALLDQRVDMRDVSAGLITLAVKGYLTIDVEKPGLLGSRNATINLTEKVAGNDLGEFEKQLLGKLKSGGNSIRKDELNVLVGTHIGALQTTLYQGLVDRGYYRQAPNVASTNGCLIGLALTVGVAWLLHSIFSFGADVLSYVVGCAVSLAMIIFYSKMIPQRTQKGADTANQVAGFEAAMRGRRSYLEWVADKKIAEAKYEEYLPYAIAFGLVQQWSDTFREVVTHSPGWYRSPYMYDSWTINSFASDLDSSTRSIGYAAMTPPRTSSSSGSSGFSSGGGFSGGGFGGGGGGSW